MHESLITGRAKFFECATKAHWQQERRLSLPEDDPAVFSQYLNLIYTNRLTTQGRGGEWLKLTRLFVLAEKLQDQRAKNKVIDGMHAMFHQYVVKGVQRPDMTPSARAETIRELYDGTPSCSPARKLVVDLYADVGEEQWLFNGQYELPEDFVYDVAIALIRRRSSTPVSFGIHNPSKVYHEREIPKPKEK